MHLYLAIKEGNIVKLTELLAAGANPNEYYDGETPLTQAVFQAVLGIISLADCLYIIDALLAKGADINLKSLSEHGYSALHWAAKFKVPELISHLLNCGADVHSENKLGETALHLVVCQRDESEESQIKSAEILLEYGADVNAKNRFEITPFSHAIDKPKLYKLLFEYGNPGEKSSLFKEKKHSIADFSFYKKAESHPILPKKTESHNQPLLPEAYNYRDIESLQKLSSWTKQTEETHKEHNRVLQPGFMHRDPNEVLADLKLAGVDWLASFCCPSIRTALILHIAKEIIVNYQVKETEINQVAHDLFHSLLNTEDGLLENLEKEVEQQLNTNMQTGAGCYGGILYKHAIELLTFNSIYEPNSAQISAAIRLFIDGERSKLTHGLVSLKIKRFLSDNPSYFHLSFKPVYNLGQSEDYCLLGAPGSGKSTIIKLHFDDEKKTEFISYAIDNYRPIIIPGAEDHEEKLTKNVQIRTQDMAYLIKNLVDREIDRKIKEEKSRPNIIVECVNLYSNSMIYFLSQGHTTYLVAAYRGDPGYTGIAERVNKRACNVSASPIDKGRFIGTKNLLNSHAKSAQEFIKCIPPNALATVYDTAVIKGHLPIKIAVINTHVHTIEISNLRVMSEFLNKRNLNINAINQVDLILKNDNFLNLLVTHPEHKAESLLNLMSQDKEKRSFTLLLQEDDLLYAEIRKNNNNYFLKVKDWDLFNEKSMADNIESSVLRAITRQVIEGGFRNSYALACAKGDKESFLQSLDKYEGLMEPQSASISLSCS